MHLIVISIPKQRITAYGAGGFHRQGAVSTGRTGFPTPTGVFSIIQKNRYHRSNIYSGAPMPFMQRITWSGVAMHEGVLPGYPASHGCIRLTHQFASELWGMTRMGVRVIVTPDDAQPVEMAHAKLFVPNMTPAPVATTDVERIKPSLVAMAGDKTAEASAAPQAAAKLLSPLDRAKVEKAQMVVEAPAKAKAAKAAAEVSAVKASEANKAIKALREAEQALAAARDRSEAAAKAVEQAKTPEAVEKAKAAQSAAEAKVEEASKAVTRGSRRRSSPRRRKRSPPRRRPGMPRRRATSRRPPRGRASAPPSRSRCSSARRPVASRSARPGGPSTTRRQPSRTPVPRSAPTFTSPRKW